MCRNTDGGLRGTRALNGVAASASPSACSRVSAVALTSSGVGVVEGVSTRRPIHLTAEVRKQLLKRLLSCDVRLLAQPSAASCLVYSSLWDARVNWYARKVVVFVGVCCADAVRRAFVKTIREMREERRARRAAAGTTDSSSRAASPHRTSSRGCFRAATPLRVATEDEATAAPTPSGVRAGAPIRLGATHPPRRGSADVLTLTSALKAVAGGRRPTASRRSSTQPQPEDARNVRFHGHRDDDDDNSVLAATAPLTRGAALDVSLASSVPGDTSPPTRSRSASRAVRKLVAAPRNAARRRRSEVPATPLAQSTSP